MKLCGWFTGSNYGEATCHRSIRDDMDACGHHTPSFLAWKESGMTLAEAKALHLARVQAYAQEAAEHRREIARVIRVREVEAEAKVQPGAPVIPQHVARAYIDGLVASGTTCPITLESLSKYHSLDMTSCGHVFAHGEISSSWACSPASTGTCPVCRAEGVSLAEIVPSKCPIDLSVE